MIGSEKKGNEIIRKGISFLVESLNTKGKGIEGDLFSIFPQGAIFISIQNWGGLIKSTNYN